MKYIIQLQIIHPDGRTQRIGNIHEIKCDQIEFAVKVKPELNKLTKRINDKLVNLVFNYRVDIVEDNSVKSFINHIARLRY